VALHLSWTATLKGGPTSVVNGHPEGWPHICLVGPAFRLAIGVALPATVCYIRKVLVGPGTPYLGPDTKKSTRTATLKGRPTNGRTKAVRVGRHNNLIG